MADETPDPGVVISFYSYKGGTGRSMAVADTACLITKRLSTPAARVLAIDWDLEAPGLHRFFPSATEHIENVNRPGILNYFEALRERLIDTDIDQKDLFAPGGWRLLDQLLPLQDYVIPDVVPGLDLVKAGRLDADYPRRVVEFAWKDFFDRFGAVFSTFRQLISKKYAYCLIDSRTGLNDISGLCAMILPEKLVTVFTPNQQSLTGTLELTEQAVQYRRASDDFRPLAAFPVPSRIELGEKSLREQWRLRYQGDFEELFRRLYDLQSCDLTDYFNEVQLPHVSYYAYGENLAVVSERSEALSLARAYEAFADRLLSLDVPWGRPAQEIPSEAAPTTPTRLKTYDVFLSHAMSDSWLAEALAKRLKRYGLRPYLDIWEVLPGEDLLPSIESAIDLSKSLAVLVGEGATGAWQDPEVRMVIQRHAQGRDLRVIPVLLPGSRSDDGTIHLPDFLRRRNFVDMTGGVDDDDAFLRLVSGIRGQAVTPQLKVTFQSCEYRRVMVPGSGPRADRYHLEASFEIDGRDLGASSIEIAVAETEQGPPTTTVRLRSHVEKLNHREFDRVALMYFREAMGIAELPVHAPADSPEKQPRRPKLSRTFVLPTAAA